MDDHLCEHRDAIRITLNDCGVDAEDAGLVFASIDAIEDKLAARIRELEAALAARDAQWERAIRDSFPLRITESPNVPEAILAAIRERLAKEQDR